MNGNARRGAFAPALAAALCALFASCAGAGGRLRLAEGVFLYSRGDFARAAGGFVRALEYPAARAYARYALGAAYLAMDDGEAALACFTEAENAAPAGKEHRELRYRARYNSGVARFQRADYRGAAGDFRRALRIDPARAEAKHNLELSLLSANRQSERADVRTTRPGSVGESRDGPRSGVILDFMRRRETDRWKSFEWGGDDDSSAPDY